MSDFGQALLLVGIYRIILLFVGLAFGVMGYLLFGKGLHASAGNLQATSRTFRLILKDGAPGVFFALFGMAVIGIAIWRGIDIERVRGSLLATRANAAGVSTNDSAAALRLTLQERLALQRAKVLALATPEVVAAATKAAAGQQLNAEERRALQDWVDSFRIEAHQPTQDKNVS